MTEKITGYLLVLAGLAIMAFSVFSIYQVFTAKVKPVDLFNLPGLSVDLSSLVGENVSPEQKAQIKSQENLKTELVSPDVLNEPLNLLGHILFMGFVLNVGYKVSSLGVQFVRPIKVKLRVEEKMKGVLEPDGSSTQKGGEQSL